MSNEEGNEVVELDPSLIVDQPDPDPEPVEEEPTQETKSEDSDIPPKYAGKSQAELIRMHRDAERLLGRQGNELGEIRKTLDDILQAQASPAPTETRPETDFFEDPKGAMREALQEVVGNDPRLKALEEQTEAQKKQAKALALKQAHPDFMEIVGSSEFAEWVGKSQRRLAAFQKANADYDVDTANEIIQDYKELQSARGTTVKAAKENRSTAVKAASTGSGKASAETRGKPTLSREALIELKRTNPDKYYAMMPQIKAAYMEGRVQ